MVTGGQVAEYFRLGGGGADFVDVLRGPAVSRRDATLGASFLLRGTSAGTVNLALSLTPMGGSAVSLPVSISVGSVAIRASTCSGGSASDTTLYP